MRSQVFMWTVHHTVVNNTVLYICWSLLCIWRSAHSYPNTTGQISEFTKAALKWRFSELGCFIWQIRCFSPSVLVFVPWPFPRFLGRRTEAARKEIKERIIEQFIRIINHVSLNQTKHLDRHNLERTFHWQNYDYTKI